MALYSVRSERQLCEQLGYNLLFRWFLDMELEEESFDATVFSKNRERLLEHEVGRLFFDTVVKQAREANLISDSKVSVTVRSIFASLVARGAPGRGSLTDFTERTHLISTKGPTQYQVVPVVF